MIVIIEAFLSFGIGQIKFLTWKVHISPFCDRKEGGNGYMSETFWDNTLKNCSSNSAIFKGVLLH